MNDDTIEPAIDNNKIVFNERVAYDKLSFYYISLPIMLLGNILGAFLLAAVQINVVDISSVSIWLLLSFIMFLYRFYHYYLFKKESEVNKLRDANIWLDKYYSNTLLTGIIWGSAAFLLFPETELLHQMIILFFLFAISFSAMGILASEKDLLLTYVLVTFSPMLLRLFFLEDTLYTTIAYILLSLMLIMIITANYYGSIINNSLENRQYFITIKHTHEKLKERFFSLFERAPVGIFYYNHLLELQDVNLHFIEMNQCSKKDTFIDRSLYYLNNQKIIEAHKVVFDGLTGNYKGPFKILNSEENLYVNLSTVPMLDSDGNIAGGICIINDITNEITAKEEMVRNAYYDILTNIPNRTLLMDKLKSFIDTTPTEKEYSALLFMGIDNFKKVNETYGHHIGDTLLKKVVHRINQFVKSHDTFARISGDKFVIMLSSLESTEKETKETTEQYIENLNKHFIEPLSIAGEDYHLSFSIGVVLFNTIEVSAHDLLKRAETAMYEAKKNARGTSQFYEPRMDTSIKEDLTLVNDMYKALKNNEFLLHYQPQIDIATNKIISAEVLIRWDHPTKGFIPPSQFIPLAEESGIILKLEEYIFEQAIQDIKKLSESPQGFTLNHIAFNVSTISFLQPHFIERLILLIEKYHVKPEWVELEITESGIMQNIKDAVQKIKELKELGFTFAIDDFGTGYSSLSYLKELPVDILKIDQSFIRDMNYNKDDSLIVETIIAIGQKFNLKIIAEGVENEEVLLKLAHFKCDIYQGNYKYKSMPLESFEKLL
jgi:diguanylate cyclase (GGDEF)-like protein